MSSEGARLSVAVEKPEYFDDKRNVNAGQEAIVMPALIARKGPCQMSGSAKMESSLARMHEWSDSDGGLARVIGSVCRQYAAPWLFLRKLAAVAIRK